MAGSARACELTRHARSLLVRCPPHRAPEPLRQCIQPHKALTLLMGPLAASVRVHGRPCACMPAHAAPTLLERVHATAYSARVAPACARDLARRSPLLMGQPTADMRLRGTPCARMRAHTAPTLPVRVHASSEGGQAACAWRYCSRCDCCQSASAHTSSQGAHAADGTARSQSRAHGKPSACMRAHKAFVLIMHVHTSS